MLLIVLGGIIGGVLSFIISRAKIEDTSVNLTHGLTGGVLGLLVSFLTVIYLGYLLMGDTAKMKDKWEKRIKADKAGACVKHFLTGAVLGLLVYVISYAALTAVFKSLGAM